MKTHIAIASVLILTTLGLNAGAKVKVVSTLPDFAALASELGGDRVETVSLIQGTQDPHFVDAKPSLVLEVNRADLLVRIGMGLEDGWLPVLLTQSRNGAVQPGAAGYLDASAFIKPKEVVANPDRRMGDVHGQGNPHYYTGPDEMFRIADAIHQKLEAIDPGGRDAYETRWKVFEQTFRRKSAEWRKRIEPLRGTRVVEYHKSWIYLLDWLGFESAGALEPLPGIPPSPSHVTELLSQVRQQNVKFVFQEIYQPQRLSRLFAEKSGAKLVVLPSMVGALPGIRTVWDKFDRIVDLLTQP